MFGSSWGSVLGACRAGAEWAWRQVYEDVAPLLRYHRARGTPDPEDLVGDTFVRVVRGLAGFEGNEEQFRAWVFTISRRRAIDLARTRARRPEKPDPGDGLTDAVGQGTRRTTRFDRSRSIGSVPSSIGSLQTSATCSCSACCPT
jgi:RNA polymerase sigma factor (sigma-70 family)